MDDADKKLSALQIGGIVAGILAILGATFAWFAVTIINTHYNPMTSENWTNYAIPAVMWLVFCGTISWLIMRLARKSVAKKGWIVAGCFAAFTAMASILIFVD